MTRARRIAQIRARALVRRWEYRQRHLAHGAWGRFRIALAMANEAYAIDDATWRALVEDGYVVDQRGAGLEPPRAIVWITAERATRLAGVRLAMRLDPAMLAETRLALVPFAGSDYSVGASGTP